MNWARPKSLSGLMLLGLALIAVAAIDWQAHQFQKRTGLKVHLDTQLETVDISREGATAVFRIFQEVLTNVLRHAQANHFNAQLVFEEGEIRLTLSDDGKGFDVARVRGLGLLGMEERVKHLGGTLHLRSQPGGGTLLNLAARGPDWITGGGFGPEGGVVVTAVLLIGVAALLSLRANPKEAR